VCVCVWGGGGGGGGGGVWVWGVFFFFKWVFFPFLKYKKSGDLCFGLVVGWGGGGGLVVVVLSVLRRYFVFIHGFLSSLIH